jgi:hypothetical protein
MYVSDVHRYPQSGHATKFDLDVAEGTERLDLFFDGPPDETLSRLQTPALFFYPETSSARLANRARPPASRRTAGISRNVVILWIRPDVPPRLRAIVRGCLRP